MGCASLASSVSPSQSPVLAACSGVMRRLVHRACAGNGLALCPMCVVRAGPALRAIDRVAIHRGTSLALPSALISLSSPPSPCGVELARLGPRCAFSVEAESA